MERKVTLSSVVVHTEIGQLKIIWNLIQENSEDYYELSVLRSALQTHTHIAHYRFTVRKSKCFRFLADLELEWNVSLIYYRA